MNNVRLTWQPKRDARDAQPNYVDLDSVPSAPSRAYEHRKTHGFDSAMEISRDGEALYKGEALARAVSRISLLISLDDMSLEKAAALVAIEDGFLALKP